MDSIPQKRCTGCEKSLPFTEFYKNARAGDGLTARCKTCSKKASRESRLRHVDSARERDRRWRQANPDKVARQRLRAVERKLGDPTLFQEYLERREEAQNNTAAPMTTEERAQRKRELRRKWQKENPQAVRKAIKRRWERLNFSGDYTESEWQGLCDWFGNACLCCGCNGELTRDHVIPLRLGGQDTLTNVQPLCPDCNSRKGSLKIHDYRDHEKLAKFLKQWQDKRNRQTA